MAHANKNLFKQKKIHSVFSVVVLFTLEDGLQPLPTKLGTVNGTKIMGVVPTAVGWGTNSAVAVPTPSRQLQAVTSSCGVCWTPAAAVVAVVTVACCAVTCCWC